MAYAYVTEIPTALPDVKEETIYDFQIKGGHSVNIEISNEVPDRTSLNNITARSAGETSLGEFKTAPGESVYVWIQSGLQRGFIVYFERT